MTQATTGVARVSAVSHRYASTLALDKVELEIPSGRMVGLIGPDGVGKSTLLGILAGVRRIQTGTVQVLGGDMRNHRHRTALCPRVAYMPQGLGRNLYMTLSVFENIDFFARLFGQQRAEQPDAGAQRHAAPASRRRPGEVASGVLGIRPGTHAGRTDVITGQPATDPGDPADCLFPDSVCRNRNVRGTC